MQQQQQQPVSASNSPHDEPPPSPPIAGVHLATPPVETSARASREAEHLGSEAGGGIDELVRRVTQRVERIHGRCARVDIFTAAQLEFASTTDDVKTIYADIQLFVGRHRAPGGLSAAATGDRLARSLRACRKLTESEAQVAAHMRQWMLLMNGIPEGGAPAQQLFLRQVATWHAHARQQLSQLESDLERLASPDEATAERPSARGDADEIDRRLRDLETADQLDRAAAWSALAALDSAAWLRRLEGDESAANSMASVLWRVADLVAIEDRRRDGILLQALARTRGGAWWALLQELLNEENPEVEERHLRSRLAARGQNPAGAPEVPEMEMAWRGLIAAHPRDEVKRAAARCATLNSLWQIVVYPDADLATIYAIAEQVAVRGDQDLHKVFFDCVKARLMAKLGALHSEEELALPLRFVDLFFTFSFFIQTRYFEQLESILQLLLAQSSRFGVPLARLDRDLHRLEMRRFRAGQPEATDPRSLDRLPLPVQRHLAREGCYLEFFACHGNHLIAREVAPHVTPDNLPRFLRLRELNRQMLEETMRRLDVRGKTDLVLEVLLHPKCPMVFASKHLPGLNRTQLHTIVRGSSTHSEVKRKSMLQMIQLNSQSRTGR
ncbi:MAG: hypothetical protein AAF725_05650 [Acidobacteriota bacterium]